MKVPAFPCFCADFMDEITGLSTILLCSVLRFLDFTFVSFTKTNLRADLAYNGVLAILTLRGFSFHKVAGNNHPSRFGIVFP